MKLKNIALLAVIIALTAGCKKSGDTATSNVSIAQVHTDGRWFKDSQNRVVILRGINVGGNVKWAPFDFRMEEADWDVLYNWGYNVARLLIIWEAIEPEEGVYSEEFFQKVDQQIAWAEERGIFVILDMHQDVWGPAFGGDGAPRWASRLDIPFTWNNPWGINYFAPAVITSYDDFWASAELQDHYANAWLKAIERYKDRAIVIGYDLYNEPFFGSRTPWNFERDYLGPFQDRLAARIRAVDPDRIIFYEPMIFTSGGIPTFLPPPAIRGNVALAPHFYDPVLGMIHTEPYDLDDSRMDNMMALRTTEGVGLGNIPWLLGEFGVASGPNSDIYIHDIYDMFEKHMASGTYWCYGKDSYMAPLNGDGSERPRVTDMVRPYPVRIAGEPVSFSFDQATKVFTLTYRESADAQGPTEIYIPEARHYPNGFTIETRDVNWSPEYDGRILKFYHDPNEYTHVITLRPKP